MKKTLLFLLATIAPVAANAQAYGTVSQFSSFGLSRIHQLSTWDTGISTARSAAMAGAFTSLGADLSSMSINPAGLGMYRSSEVGFTMGPVITDRTNAMRGEKSVSDNRTSFALNNFGMAFNLFESAGSTTALTVGLGYSRLADFNFRSRMEIANGYNSILQMFDWQIADGSVGNETVDSWGAFLSQHEDVALLDDRYVPRFGAVLSDAAGVFKRNNTFSRGSAGEYSLAVGWNLRNRLYLGLSLGIIDIYQNRETTYSEDYSNNEGVVDPATYMDFSQRVKTMGNGVNLKMGLVYRPVPQWRFGLAFHTPTIVNTRDLAIYEMEAGYIDGSTAISPNFPQEEYEDDFCTPSRLLAGVSYTFAGRGIVALDYEHTFYNGVGLTGDELYSRDVRRYFRDKVKEYFTGANTLRLGTEVMAGDVFMLRGGVSYTGGGVKKKWQKDALEIDLPVDYERISVSCGFGVLLGSVGRLDMTYSLQGSKFTSYDAFYYVPNAIGPEPVFAGKTIEDRITTKQLRHSIMLALSLKI